MSAQRGCNICGRKAYYDIESKKIKCGCTDDSLKIRELNNYLESINTIVWEYLCVIPECRHMTESQFRNKILEVLNKWAEIN